MTNTTIDLFYWAKYLNLSKTKKVKDIYNRNGIKNRSKFVIYLKIFFNYRISDVVNELNRSSNLRKFTGISEVTDESQVL